MARFARVVMPEVPHHVTQRGNARQRIFAADTDRATYLALLRQYSQLYRLSVLGYCLMSNHVHLIVVPGTSQALSQTLKLTHGRYAAYWNARISSSGHVWQGRFYSCPLDQPHLWAALRYVELNPVRAAIVKSAEQWRWSTAAVHCGGLPDPLVKMEEFTRRWAASEWRAQLQAGDSQEDVAALRQFTHTGRPLGSAEFTEELEQSTMRILAAAKAGRPNKKIAEHRRRRALAFVA
ncbi:MAG TPA: transposase [Candidatus Binatia bacterium]|nr:transposase [Candidatus Binatia bacterium]